MSAFLWFWLGSVVGIVVGAVGAFVWASWIHRRLLEENARLRTQVVILKERIFLIGERAADRGSK